MDPIEKLLALNEIRELSATYARGLDRLERDLVRSVFHDDATTHYGSFTGGPDAMADMAMTALASHGANQHLVGQINVEFDSDTLAHGEVYFIGYHRIFRDGAPFDLMISGRYADEYVKREGVWKMSHRAEIVDWTRTDPAADDYLIKRPESLRGGRQGTDLTSTHNYNRDAV